MNGFIVTAVNSIQSESQTTHVKLSLRKVFDAGRIVNMSQNFMVKGGL